jgi:biotin carboxylase
VIKRLLVANRGEVAVRIMATAAVLGIETVAVYPADDAACAHVSRADTAVELPGTGPAAYLDVDVVIAAAVGAGCDTLHPGYGFLAERPELAARCAQAGVRFVGPGPGALALFGDKTAARSRARELGVPVLAGTDGGTSPDSISLDRARALLREHGAVMVKALAGAGGRGLRPVTREADLAGAMRRCASEAAAAFGGGAVYVEQLLAPARHIEVQVIGDGTGAVAVLGDRDCSLQRRRQKLVEIAPAMIGDAIRARLSEAAGALVGSARYAGLATVEFLVQPDTIAFLEVNPRLQVEHTVTEQVTGLDLVELALRVADGATLDALRLDTLPPAGLPRRHPGPGQRRDPAARRHAPARRRHAQPVPAPGGARRARRHRSLPRLGRQSARRLAAGQGDRRRRHARGGGPPGGAGAGRVRHRRGARQRGAAAGARARHPRGRLGRRARRRTRCRRARGRRARGRGAARPCRRIRAAGRHRRVGRAR